MRFGSTKKISYLINEKLKKVVIGLESPKKTIAEETFGLWKTWKISSEGYVRKLRKESEKRLKRLGI
jgi:pyrimidine deaminase RibD-like protein